MARLWLVDRSYDDRNLITLVYATPDGERQHRRQFAAEVIQRRGTTVTAAVDADEGELDPVPEEDRERFGEEAQRTAEQYEPDEPI